MTRRARIYRPELTQLINVMTVLAATIVMIDTGAMSNHDTGHAFVVIAARSGEHHGGTTFVTASE